MSIDRDQLAAEIFLLRLADATKDEEWKQAEAIRMANSFVDRVEASKPKRQSKKTQSS